MINIEIKDQAVTTLLSRLAERMANLLPAMQDIGEALSEGTKQRFGQSADWDGHAWAKNSQTTVSMYLGTTKGNYKKNGSLSKKGAARSGRKKPLIGETRSLSTTIDYQASKDRVTIGSPMEYAGTHQFGAKRGAFGSHNGRPIPWGDIPARPFLPLDDSGNLPTAASRMVHDILSAYLTP